MSTTLSNTPNQTSFLRTSRNFPTDDVEKLATEVNRTYLDIASSVNTRVIGIFQVNFPLYTGESWFVSKNRRQQSLRQVYTFTGPSLLINIPHNINTTTISGFVRIYGTFTDGTSWYPLNYVDVVSATNQVNVIVNSTNIVITSGAGTPPAILSGTVVLEWIALP